MDRAEQMVIIGGIAADQWGLVTARQAATEGVNGVQLKRLTDAGLLENVGRGVYLVAGAGYPQHLEIKVAWLRLAPVRRAWQRGATDIDSGVISHSSACLLHDLGDIPAGDVEITVPRRRTARDPDVRLRIATLEPADATVIDGLPVTTAQRTIVDLLRTHADAGHIGGVIADAEHRDLITLSELADQVAGWAKAYGVNPEAEGRVLIDHLVAQAGARLRADDLRDAVQAAYGQGVVDSTIDDVTLRLAAALAPALQQMAANLDTSGLREGLRYVATSGELIRTHLDTSAMGQMLQSIAMAASEVQRRKGETAMAQLQDAIKRSMAPIDEMARQNMNQLAIHAAMQMQGRPRNLGNVSEGARPGITAAQQPAMAERPSALPAGGFDGETDEEDEAAGHQAEEADRDEDVAASRPDLGK